MAQILRLLGIIAFATFLSFGFYSQGIVYLCLFLFVFYLVIGRRAIRDTVQIFTSKTNYKYTSTAGAKKSKRKTSKIMKRAKKLGLTIHSSNSSTISMDSQNVMPKLSVIDGKRTR